MCLIVNSAWSDNPPPTPSISVTHPKAQANHERGHANEDKRGTKEFPIVVEVLQSPGDENKAEQSRKDHEEEIAINRIISYFTGLSAFFTLVLAVAAYIQIWMFWRQLQAMKTSVEDGTKVAHAAIESASAAKSTADSVIHSERARIFVQIEFRPGAPASDESVIRAKANVLNHGKTVARIRMIRAYSLVQETTPINLISDPTTDSALPDGMGIEPGGKLTIPIPCRVTHDDWQRIQRLETNWFVLGKIVYIDIFGIERETGFCWRLVTHMGNNIFTFDRESSLNSQT
jgi:hypothetical protein